MNKMNFALGAFAALLLTACGGGESVPANSPASKMAPYVGTWVGPCEGYVRQYLTIRETASNKDNASLATMSEYYAGIGCTGTVVATETYSANASTAYGYSTNADVVFNLSSASVVTMVHFVLVSAPAYKRTPTGTGVTRRFIGGQFEWCIAYGDGGSTCYWDETVPSADAVSRGFYVNENKLYILFQTPGGSSYNVANVLTRK